MPARDVASELNSLVSSGFFVQAVREAPISCRSAIFGPDTRRKHERLRFWLRRGRVFRWRARLAGSVRTRYHGSANTLAAFANRVWWGPLIAWSQAAAMTTTHTTHHHDGRVLPERRGHKARVAMIGLAVAGAVVAGLLWSSSSNAGRQAPAMGSVTSSVVERSALLDGAGFDAAVAEVVFEATRPSILEQPAAFATDVAGAVAALEGPRSALRDGEAFRVAVADALDALDARPSALLDGHAFDGEIAEVVAAAS